MALIIIIEILNDITNRMICFRNNIILHCVKSYTLLTIEKPEIDKSHFIALINFNYPQGSSPRIIIRNLTLVALCIWRLI